MQMEKREEVRKINSKLKSFQSTLPGTQMGVFARDEQQIKMGDEQRNEMGSGALASIHWV